MDVMKTLFLNPPSYDDFDGGAGSRYQATREVWSFWYPTWLAYPAGLIPGARLLDGRSGAGDGLGEDRWYQLSPQRHPEPQSRSADSLQRRARPPPVCDRSL